MKRAALGAAAGVLLSVGCGGGPTDGTDPEPQATTAGVLAYRLDAGVLDGTFTVADNVLSFRGQAKDGQLLDVTLEVNGAVLSSTISKAEQAIELDGFVAGSGAETQLRHEDRSIILALERALQNEKGLQEEPVAVMLQRSVSVWAQVSDTFPLTRSVMVDKDKSYTSLCYHCEHWTNGTHDCDRCSEGESNCVSTAALGSRGSPTLYWSESYNDPNTGSWTSVTPDHVPFLYETGECYGRCGDGCTDVTYGQILTSDCLHHDQCVRNGHHQASPFCDDEFGPTLDDYFGVPPFIDSAPTCGGSSVSQQSAQVCGGRGTNCFFIPKLGGACTCKGGNPVCPNGGQVSGPISAGGFANCQITTSFCP